MPTLQTAPKTAITAERSHDLLARFNRYHPARIDLTLDRIVRLLADLGDPQRRLPPVIHVAGTNGKGSTIAILRAIYEAAGLAVSTYTSPHLVDITERFVLAGATISSAALVELFEEVDAANRGQPVTEFEIVTAAAFVALSRTPADIVLLETGLGGRYDATNVIAAPLATVITPVSLDHQAFLGTDIAAIAGEKAAIQKARVPSIVAPQTIEAGRVIEQIGSEIGAIPYRAGADWSFEPTTDGFIYRSRETTLNLPSPALGGPHQIINAATAVACVERCERIGIADSDIAAGIANARWPGRFERLPDGALKRRLPDGWEIWLDAGHNGAAGMALASALRQINAEQPKPLHIVFGMLDDKDPVAFVRPLADGAQSVTAVPLAGEPRSHDPQASVAALQAAGTGAQCAPSLDAALDQMPGPSGDARVLICGSHVLVGAALRANQQPA